MAAGSLKPNGCSYTKASQCAARSAQAQPLSHHAHINPPSLTSGCPGVFLRLRGALLALAVQQGEQNSSKASHEAPEQYTRAKSKVVIALMGTSSRFLKLQSQKPYSTGLCNIIIAEDG